MQSAPLRRPHPSRQPDFYLLCWSWIWYSTSRRLGVRWPWQEDSNACTPRLRPRTWYPRHSRSRPRTFNYLIGLPKRREIILWAALEFISIFLLTSLLRRLLSSTVVTQVLVQGATLQPVFVRLNLSSQFNCGIQKNEFVLFIWNPMFSLRHAGNQNWLERLMARERSQQSS